MGPPSQTQNTAIPTHWALNPHWTLCSALPLCFLLLVLSVPKWWKWSFAWLCKGEAGIWTQTWVPEAMFRPHLPCSSSCLVCHQDSGTQNNTLSPSCPQQTTRTTLPPTSPDHHLLLLKRSGNPRPRETVPTTVGPSQAKAHELMEVCPMDPQPLLWLFPSAPHPHHLCLSWYYKTVHNSFQSTFTPKASFVGIVTSGDGQKEAQGEKMMSFWSEATN